MNVTGAEFGRIIEILKENPRGMNINDISQAINMNRLTMAKYLDILTIAGYLDMKTFGPSKVYYLSQRLPVSAILNLSSDFIVILDLDLRIINVNDKFLEFAGLKKDDILLKNIETLRFMDDFTPRINPHIQDALDGKESSVNATYKKGECIHHFLIKFIPMTFESGQNGVTVIFVDATERERAEEALRESERRFRAIVNQTCEFVGLLTVDGTLIEANQPALGYVGAMEQDVIGKPFWGTPWWRHSPKQQNRLKKAMRLAARGEFVRFEATFLASDGSLNDFDFSIKPAADESGMWSS